MAASPQYSLEYVEAKAKQMELAMLSSPECLRYLESRKRKSAMPPAATEEIQKQNEELEKKYISIKRQREPALPPSHVYKWLLFIDVPDSLVQNLLKDASVYLDDHKKAQQPDTLIPSASVQLFPSDRVIVKLSSEQNAQRAKIHKDNYRKKPANAEKIKLKAESKKEENKAYAKKPHVIQRKQIRTYVRQNHVKLLKEKYPDIYARQDALLEEIAAERMMMIKKEISPAEDVTVEDSTVEDLSEEEEPVTKKQRIE